MNIIDVAKSRKTCKVYDASRHLTTEQINDIKTLLRYSPSSVNVQPWHYFLIESEAGKEKILPGFMEFNRPKVLDSTITIIFAVRNTLGDQHVKLITEQEDQDLRFLDEATKEGVAAGRKKFIDLNSKDQKDLNKWNEKQAYIALGTLLLGAAAMGVDATPIEGILTDELDKILDLPSKDLHSIVAVTIGYSNQDLDYNAKLPKSRLPAEEIFTTL
ncbi:oxygen-insensitive NAD(P)H nitroreductase [Wohlfahrtiimonas larvae]|uniref:Oxygen-insensitive NAD(P)H-dependent nitroreductase NfsB n=1 Tax=Wohlfahrtiimonas larvae TaxID=1157986 RepID=A0ABP9MUL7_9GAMM|nr:oxygen-insensitive NAD(P)H nitroreductase [Wohlfahrtiimonas larvae]